KIIYNLVDDVEKALNGMLEPTYVEVITGRAEVRAVFTATKKNKAAGAYVLEGKISRGDPVRVWRGEEKVAESTVSSLKRFKDNIKEVAADYECGIGIDGFDGIQVGDILETFNQEKVSQ
ncbi:MAG: translation initiation factor IF-2, partial [Dehalococcoidales bacterium]|nr:translation initiation factor IF-2 [Dehalococcoidales bacterium]